jgi:hypothetical protein
MLSEAEGHRYIHPTAVDQSAHVVTAAFGGQRQ